MVAVKFHRCLIDRRCYDEMAVNTLSNTMLRHRTSLIALLLLAALPISAACQRERESVISRLPLPPKFVYQNRSSIELFREADQLARQEPLSAERIGRLGMTYHAYRFTDEARQSYELARNIAPNEYRWIYYQAFLEKSVGMKRLGTAKELAWVYFSLMSPFNSFMTGQNIVSDGLQVKRIF